MVRIEIHLDKTETDILEAIAKEDGRSRKNLCETEIRKLIKERGQKIKTATENVGTKLIKVGQFSNGEAVYKTA
jgi:hypothetical protein